MKKSILFHQTLIKSHKIHPQKSHFPLNYLINNHSTFPNSWNSINSNLIITNPILITLQNCNSMSQLKQIQAQMTRNGLFLDVFPVSRIIAFCALSNHGDINYGNTVFNQILCPNVYIWNCMIKGFCRVKNYVMGLSIFRRMVRDGGEFDERSFVYAMKAYGGVSGFGEGRVVHCLVWKTGFGGNVLVVNGLVHFYGEGGFLSCARQVFDECSDRDVVTWTSMIDGYVQKGVPDEGLRVFGLMVRGTVLVNEVTVITLLSACGIKGDLNLGRRVHCFVEKSDVKRTLNLRNAMLDMYVKCGCLRSARRVFEMMECRDRDVFSWTSMVNGFAKYGELGLARKYFDEMPRKNVVSWSAMIAGYTQNNRHKDALELFQSMVDRGFVPIEATLVSVLSACAQSSHLDLGQLIHRRYIHRNGIELTVSLGNALIDMYSKCGRIDISEELFNEMSQKDVISWNTMIVSYADHGKANEALNLFDRAIDTGMKPDCITFIGILSACSHTGLVARGRKHFTDMKQIFGLEPKVEHYACMIDLLGRVGLLDEAYDMIKSMPMRPDAAAWGALLNACRIHGNADLGKLAAAKLIELDPSDSGTYVLLANLCSKEKRWEDVLRIRYLMREKGVKKTTGRSSIEVEGEFHEFSVADDSHPRSKDVYKILELIFPLTNLEEDANQNVNCSENDDIIASG